jgi:dipeptidyl aminopeptidase/acylaminoacyl peptidase
VSLSLVALLLLPAALHGQQAYQRAPEAIRAILDVPPPPAVLVSPARDRLLLAQGVRYPPISDLAEPMLRLAGERINPQTNGPHRALRVVGLSLETIADGKERKIALPAGARLGMPQWSPDGRRFAFTNTTASGIELWVGEAETAAARRLAGLRINAAFGTPFQWLPGSKTLLCQTVPEGRGAPPPAPKVPDGPVVQESTGRPAPVRTFEDLLQNPHDEDLFDYYATSQLVLADIQGERRTPVGKPGIFAAAQPSPDGEHLLVERLHRPYSYLLPAFAFPKEVEVWSRGGKVEHRLASLPLAEHVPIEGVPTGPRGVEWRPTEPATLVWLEALDEGDPKKKVPYRDRVLMLKSPFAGQPVELSRTEHRCTGVTWGETRQVALLNEYDRSRRWRRTFLLNPEQPGAPGPVLWDRSAQDRYRDPGTPAMRPLPNGQRALWMDGTSIFLSGPGASPQGDRPFLDRFDLGTRKRERLFLSEPRSYEMVVALLADDGSRVLTRHETADEPPNYFVRSAGGARQALTHFPDPAPQLRAVKKRLVTYQRADGVPLSFTLYLPPGAEPGKPLPTVFWAYPLEFNDPSTAGQVSGSPNRFTTPAGISHLFFLTQGYAVLDDVAMPVIGDPEKVNDTYVEQIVADAKAAIDKAVEAGVTDRNRVGVGGHSYGAFMTANLLAHSDLFRAGIARSGAYNRTLTPFGFQSERRTLWEAPEMYVKVSPFMVAQKIHSPLLLIHGQADDNPGTFPIQSERLYQAIKGNGGTSRLVMLPFEAHGYQARESVEHTLWEMIAWFDRYVKNASNSEGKSG